MVLWFQRVMHRQRVSMSKAFKNAMFNTATFGTTIFDHFLHNFRDQLEFWTTWISSAPPRPREVLGRKISISNYFYFHFETSETFSRWRNFLYQSHRHCWSDFLNVLSIITKKNINSKAVGMDSWGLVMDSWWTRCMIFLYYSKFRRKNSSTPKKFHFRRPNFMILLFWPEWILGMTFLGKKDIVLQYLSEF